MTESMAASMNEGAWWSEFPIANHLNFPCLNVCTSRRLVGTFALSHLSPNPQPPSPHSALTPSTAR